MPATYIFYIREDRIDRRGTCPIILKITYSRKRKYISTGVRIEPKYWNPDRQEVRRSHRTYQRLNQELESIRENALSAFRKLNQDKKVSADAIKKRIEYSSRDDFFTLSKEYLDKLEQSGQYWTWKQTKVAIEKMKVFHKSNHLPINLIDKEFLSRLVDFLVSEYQNQPSTIHKNFETIRSVLDKAVSQHLIPENPVRGFKLPKKNGAVSKTKLLLSEIRDIEQLELQEKTNMWHSRNAFILAFYLCGMRFGDLAELRWENIKNGRLAYHMNKTGDYITLPIKDGAHAILDKYQKLEYGGFVFPFLSELSSADQKDPRKVRREISRWNALVNKYLKEIAKKSEIDEEVSMHVARHSFAQYGVNDRDIPPYKMMMLLGHKSIKTTMQYLKSLDLRTVDSIVDEIF